jgi:hypothetical protein
VPQTPGHAVEANCVWPWGFEILVWLWNHPVRLMAGFRGISQPMRAPVAGRRSVFMYLVYYDFGFLFFV